MSTINYVKGDATAPEGSGNKILVHCCNDIGAWGAGFVLALNKKWIGVSQRYTHWYREGYISPGVLDRLELGKVQLVVVEHNKRHRLVVANLIGQEGVGGYQGRPSIRYDAIDLGLQRVKNYAETNFSSVHMPRMGCGLAGGDWRVIEALIQKNLTDHGIQVTVYDL